MKSITVPHLPAPRPCSTLPSMLPLLLAAALVVPPEAVTSAFAGRPGAFVLIDCATGDTFRSDPAACAEKLPPCSTFKIWNTAIGLETGHITGADTPFWKWDGEKRWLDAWNADQTLRSAFAVSCVPAYQNLARQIGGEQMTKWIGQLSYGDRNISSGLDVFWLPAGGRNPLLISPDQQAEMIRALVHHQTGFSEKTLAVLKDVMQAGKTNHGTLHGKTGSSGGDLTPPIGWFVGYVESNGKTYAFATLLKGEKITGKDARAATEKILERMKLL